MTQVVVVGSVNVDLVTRVARHPLPGETVLGDGLAVLPGGKGANQAVAAARLGADVALVGAVGDDQFADLATSLLRDAGVDLSALQVVPGPTGTAIVAVAADGENSIIVVPGANAAVTAELVARHAALIAGANVVVVQGEVCSGAIAAAARAAEGRLVLNLAPVVALEPAVLRLADPLVVNEHEARGALALLGGPMGPGDDDAAVAQALILAGVPSVIVTLGANGALVAELRSALSADDGAAVAVVPAPKVTAVDTTGAGDAFVGALAGRLAAGADLRAAAEFGVRVGAFAVTGPGAQPSYPRTESTLP